MKTHSTALRRRRQPRRACKKQKNEEHAPLPSLPRDVLSNVLLFIDVGDVPGVTAACKEWEQALRLVEETLWLGLVRKHHPIVERITGLLPTRNDRGETILGSVESDTTSRALGSSEGSKVGELESSSSLSSRSTSEDALPPPSLNWKTQFQRRHAIIKTASSASRSTPAPSCRPLSAYFLQIDLSLYRRTPMGGAEGNPRKQVGVVSTIVEDLKYSDGRLELCLDDLNEELSRLSFTTFDITVHLFDRSSGKQTILYHGEAEEQWDFNEYFYRDFSDYNCHPLLTNLPGSLETYVLLSKNGCLCTCGDGVSFFELPRPCPCCDSHCTCCNCKKGRWSCHFKYNLCLRIQFGYDWDSVDVDEDDLLLVFQQGLVYH